jgi:hypothetical protein
MAPAAFVTLLMATVETFSVMMPALVAISVMVAAFMTFAMVMPAFVTLIMIVTVVVAFSIGVIIQLPGSQRLYSRISRTGNTAVQLDPSLGQRVLRAHADTAANQRIYLCGFQKSCESTMTASVGGNDLLRNDPAILHIEKLELLGVSKVLEDLSVFISNCDSHTVRPFLNNMIGSLIIELIISASNQEPLSIYQCFRHFPACAFIDGCYGGAGNAHPFCALLLGHSFAVEKTNGFKLIQAQYNRLSIRYFLG